MRSLQVLLWISIYLALVLAPVVLLLVASVPVGRGFWVDVSLAMGYAALAMMGVQFILTARFRRASAPFGIDIIYYFHRLMALLGFGLIIAHAIIVMVAKPGLAARLFSPDMPAHAMAAFASFALFLALIAASVWRKQWGIRYEPWRRWHGALAMAAVLLAVVHVDWAGYYIHAPWKRNLWLVITLSWVLLLVYARLIRPMFLLQKPYRVVSVEPERGNAWTLTLLPERHGGLRFQPGQFVWLTLGRSPFSLSEHPFSIASPADRSGSIAFTIKELGDFTRKIGQTPLGTRAYLDGPFGAFSTDDYPRAPGFVFLAGGVGIVPIMSMLRTLAERGDRRPVLLVYGNWTWEHVIFRDEIDALRERLRLEVVHVLQEAHPDWKGETGLLSRELLERHAPADARAREHFVCGPKPMITLVERGLHGLGIPLRRIHSELFDLV